MSSMTMHILFPLSIIILLTTDNNFGQVHAFSNSTPDRNNAVRKMRNRRRKQNPSSSAAPKRNLPASPDRNRNRNRRASLFTKHKTLPPLESLHDNNCEQVDNDHPALSTNDASDCDNLLAGPFPVVYTNDPDTTAQWIDTYVTQNYVGFDTESVPDAPWISKEPGPATVQLSTMESSLIVHLSHCRNGKVPPALVELLHSRDVVKVGVGIDDDMLELYRRLNLVGNCRFDLAGIGSQPDRMTGLKTLALDLVGVKMCKSKKLARSDWSLLPLTNKQLAYCARDAWAGAAVMDVLMQRRPDVFGIEEIMSLVNAQERSMEDIDQRARSRKQAKIALKNLLYECKLRGMEFKGRTEVDDIEAQRSIDYLQDALGVLKPDGIFVFDPVKLELFDDSYASS